MFPFLLSALGSAATGAGLSGLGAGLSSAGTALGGGAVSGLPFGLSPPTTTIPSLGGWQTTVTPAATPMQHLAQGFLSGLGKNPPQMEDERPMQAPQQQGPADVSNLLRIIQARGRLGI